MIYTHTHTHTRALLYVHILHDKRMLDGLNDSYNTLSTLEPVSDKGFFTLQVIRRVSVLASCIKSYILFFISWAGLAFKNQSVKLLFLIFCGNLKSFGNVINVQFALDSWYSSLQVVYKGWGGGWPVGRSLGLFTERPLNLVDARLLT